MGRAGTPPTIGRRGGTNHPTEPALVRERGHQRSLRGATWLSMRLKGTRWFLGAPALRAAMPRTASHSWCRTSTDRPRCPVRPGRDYILEVGGEGPLANGNSHQRLRGNVLMLYRKSSDSPSHLHPFNRIWARCGSQTPGSTSEGSCGSERAHSKEGPAAKWLLHVQGRDFSDRWFLTISPQMPLQICSPAPPEL